MSSELLMKSGKAERKLQKYVKLQKQIASYVGEYKIHNIVTKMTCQAYNQKSKDPIMTMVNYLVQLNEYNLAEFGDEAIVAELERTNGKIKELTTKLDSLTSNVPTYETSEANLPAPSISGHVKEEPECKVRPKRRPEVYQEVSGDPFNLLHISSTEDISVWKSCNTTKQTLYSDSSDNSLAYSKLLIAEPALKIKEPQEKVIKSLSALSLIIDSSTKNNEDNVGDTTKK